VAKTLTSRDIWQLPTRKQIFHRGVNFCMALHNIHLWNKLFTAIRISQKNLPFFQAWLRSTCKLARCTVYRSRGMQHHEKLLGDVSCECGQNNSSSNSTSVCFVLLNLDGGPHFVHRWRKQSPNYIHTFHTCQIWHLHRYDLATKMYQQLKIFPSVTTFIQFK
jgi:hypothetical protein